MNGRPEASRPRYVPPLVIGSRYPRALAREQDDVPVGDAREWEALAFAELAPMAELRFDRLHLRLLGEDAVLGQAIAQLWGDDFRGAVPGPDVLISLRAVERLPFESPITQAAVAGRGDRFLVKMRGVMAKLDLGAGHVSALVERGHPFQDLTNLMRAVLGTFAPRHGSWLLHTAAVETSRGLCLAVGPAQAGKSTVSRLADARPVWTDDTVLFRMDGDTLVQASTTGLWGREGSEPLEADRRARTGRVAAVLALVKSNRNQLVPLRGAVAALAVRAAMVVPVGSRELHQGALGAARDLARRVPVVELRFAHRDGSFWDLVERMPL